MWGARQGFDKPTRPPEGISCRELEHKLQNVLIFSRAFSLGRIMRLLIGAGKPRYAQVLAERALLAWFTITEAWSLRLIGCGATGARWSRCCINFRAQAC